MSAEQYARSDDRPYTGPSVSDMIRTHTLAANIMKYHSHPGSSAILDDYNLGLLEKFVNNPDQRDQILKEADLTQVEDIRDQYEGSLSGYVILKHTNEVGESVQPVLTEEEIKELKEWFAKGGSRQHSQGDLKQKHSHSHS